ncbi:DUF1553 domain-containing protein [Verrucomicrobiales bacterium BCK34]|nr:DUF1553 domain-containing protein [Verrucomicrobiales bacterium BCK34]
MKTPLFILATFLLPISHGIAAEVNFARDIRPILSDKCFFCHGPDEEHREADLRLDRKADAFRAIDGMTAFRAGDLDGSEAWHRIITDEPDDIMPPEKSNKTLTKREKDLIKAWIESGAEWTEHWAFIPPVKGAVPREENADSPIDAFIREKLEAESLSPSEETDRRTLIRRLSFDLTGLPPTKKEVENFLADTSANAVGTLVDRLLASPHFGERMALMWLDAARYGDTSVMHADGPRDMWPWRDWVVNAFNENQPYDQFSIEQIAGDLLPGATNAQLIASGFNRNHPSSDEGGAIAEELRVSYVADRVKTTSNVWLGLSMECAQCHDHKYDPISQKEYYEFYAYFNNTEDPGMQTRKGNQAPFVEVVTEVEEDALKEIEETLSEHQKKVEGERKKALTKVPAGTAAPSPDTETRLKNLKHYFPLNETNGFALLDARSGKDLAGKTILLNQPEGKFGSAIELNGTRTFDGPGFTEFDNKSKMTISAWIKIADANAGGAVFSKMDSANHYRGWDLWLQGGKPAIHLVSKWPSNALKVVAKEKLKPNQWEHVAITYNGGETPESVKIFINGKPVDHDIEAKKLTGTIRNDVPFRIGGRSQGSGAKADLDEVHIYDRELSEKEIAWTQHDLTAEAIETLAAKRTASQKTIANADALSQSGPFRNARSEEILTEAKRLGILNGKTTSMVMADNPPEKMRKTYILDRGAYDAPKEDEVITPGTLAILPPLPAEAPANRLTLANWLFSDDHPLTSRVAVNQIWQLFFGHGIVNSTADFGAQGDFPTHPELLDWLAVDFRESGWDMKRLVRQIVMSSTYRQSSHLGAIDLEKDPENRLLARAPRFRLQAEMIRDNALALSGLLLEDAGGPGVKPYQPPGLWAEVSLGGNPKFVQDKGDKLFRRSLYTYWKRSSPPPAMVIFDAPNRETCVMKRTRTNTPLQALAAMNDVQIMEASRHLANRIMKEGGATTPERAGYLFEIATARPPLSGELETLVEVHDRSLARYRNEPGKATDVLSHGDSENESTFPAPEQAAWTLVASLVLNLDEVLTRN